MTKIGQQILNALGKKDGQSPSELADRVGCSAALVNYHVRKLEVSRRVVRTGNLAHRRISLSSRNSSAKEVP